MNEKKLTLDEINPQDGEFSLTATGKTYTVRKFTVADMAWARSVFGGDNGFQAAIQDPEQLFKIAFHQMPVEQQKEFKPIELEEVDLDGNVSTIKVGGYKLLMAASSNGPKDTLNIANAVVMALTGSQPIVSEEAPKEIKKKTNQIGRK